MTHQEGQFVICGAAEEHWIATAAKTLAGAKTLATKAFPPSVGGKTEVAKVMNGQYVKVAVKYGYDQWTCLR